MPFIDNPERFKTYLLSAKELQTLQKIETSFVLPSEKKIQTLINIAYICSLEQESIIVLIASDITLLSEAKNKTTEAIKRVQEYNLAENRFFSMIMHELRTPLTGITLTLDLLEKYSETWTKKRTTNILHSNSKFHQFISKFDGESSYN